MSYRRLLALTSVALCAEPVLERTRNEFSFHLDVPYPEAAPLFGALAEKKWDPEWNPEFLYPLPAADQEGSVFAIAHGAHRAIWITTVFDLATVHVQYVYIISSTRAYSRHELTYT